MTNRALTAMLFIAIAIAAVTFIAWFESPATWTIDARVFATLFVFAAGIAGLIFRDGQ